jgi:hypothetical protein
VTGAEVSVQTSVDSALSDLWRKFCKARVREGQTGQQEGRGEVAKPEARRDGEGPTLTASIFDLKRGVVG